MRYRVKRFSKVLIDGGLVPIEKLSDEQLENVAKNDSPRNIKLSRTNQKKSDIALGAISGVNGMFAGKAISEARGKKIVPGMAKGALIGAAVGVGASEAIGYLGRRHHRKLAEEARNELKKRQK